jgi:glycosyltransferase involved in cell wall biosynthesis
VKLRGLGRSHSRISRMLSSQWKIYREALRQNASTYHFHDPELLLIGLLLRREGKKVIYDAHEDVAADISVKHYLPRWLRVQIAWAVGRFEKMCVRHFSAVITATGPIAKRFTEANSRTVVVHNYPELGELSAAIDKPWASRSMAAAYVGGIAADRGAREMVEAMALMKTGGASLELAGHFSPASLEDELSKLPGWNKVHVHGTLNRPAVSALLARVRVGLVLLSPIPNFVASVPIKMFEYMSAGIPFVASDFPGFRAIVKKHACGLVVDAANPPKIAEAIDYLLSNPPEAEQMGLRGRRAVEEEFNWSTEEKKLLELYEEIAKP